MRFYVHFVILTQINDVPAQSTYTPYINELVQLSVLKGTGNGEFSPTEKVTRAQFAVMLAKAFNLMSAMGPFPFSDVKPEEDWGKAQIMEVYEAGIIGG